MMTLTNIEHSRKKPRCHPSRVSAVGSKCSGSYAVCTFCGRFRKIRGGCLPGSQKKRWEWLSGHMIGRESVEIPRNLACSLGLPSDPREPFREMLLGGCAWSADPADRSFRMSWKPVPKVRSGEGLAIVLPLTHLKVPGYLEGFLIRDENGGGGVLDNNRNMAGSDFDGASAYRPLYEAGLDEIVVDDVAEAHSLLREMVYGVRPRASITCRITRSTRPSRGRTPPPDPASIADSALRTRWGSAPCAATAPWRRS